jgi:hypothetical protein
MYNNQGNYSQGYGGSNTQCYGSSNTQLYSQPGGQSEYSSEDKSLGRLLTASGVSNDNGRIRWPLGLAILAGRRPDELRDEIDAQVQLVATDAQAGVVSRNVSKLLAKNINEFRRLLLKDRRERFLMSSRTYDEAERFLDKLAAAQKVLEPPAENESKSRRQ